MTLLDAGMIGFVIGFVCCAIFEGIMRTKGSKF